MSFHGGLWKNHHFVAGIRKGARCSTKLFREQIGQVSILPSEDCVDQLFRKGMNFAYLICWELGGGLGQLTSCRVERSSRGGGGGGWW